MEEARQKALNGVVVGMAALTGETKPRERYDIDVMMQILPDTFNLFLHALSRLKEDKELLGYFSIAGRCNRNSPHDTVSCSLRYSWSPKRHLG